MPPPHLALREPARYMNKLMTSYTSGGAVDHDANLSIEVDHRIRNTWCSLWKYTLELYDWPSIPLELNFRTRKAEVVEAMLSDCVTWSPVRLITMDYYSEPTTSYWPTTSDRESINELTPRSLVGRASRRHCDVDPIRDICGSYGEHKTSNMRHVWRTRGRCGCRGEAQKLVCDNFWANSERSVLVDDCSLRYEWKVQSS